MKAMKFKILERVNSDKIQERLFELGYCWLFNYNGQDLSKTVKVGISAIFATEKGELFHGYYDKYYFDKCDAEEYFLDHFGNIVPTSPSVAINLCAADNSVGLKPKYISDQHRSQEILEAFGRYVQAGKKIPNDWLIEFCKLNQE